MGRGGAKQKRKLWLHKCMTSKYQKTSNVHNWFILSPSPPPYYISLILFVKNRIVWWNTYGISFWFCILDAYIVILKYFSIIGKNQHKKKHKRKKAHHNLLLLVWFHFYILIFYINMIISTTNYIFYFNRIISACMRSWKCTD